MNGEQSERKKKRKFSVWNINNDFFGHHSLLRTMFIHMCEQRQPKILMK